MNFHFINIVSLYANKKFNVYKPNIAKYIKTLSYFINFMNIVTDNWNYQKYFQKQFKRKLIFSNTYIRPDISAGFFFKHEICSFFFFIWNSWHCFPFEINKRFQTIALVKSRSSLNFPIINQQFSGNITVLNYCCAAPMLPTIGKYSSFLFVPVPPGTCSRMFRGRYVPDLNCF